MADNDMALRLRAYDATGVKEQAFTQDEVKLGRSEGNDFRVVADSITRTHARFRRVDGRWIVQDGKSTNGTRLIRGGELRRVNTEFLESGDELLFGKVLVTVDLIEEWRA